MFEQLGNIRVRHSVLACLHMQMKNYVECASRNYLGETQPCEKELIAKLENNLSAIEKVLLTYKIKEEEILN